MNILSLPLPVLGGGVEIGVGAVAVMGVAVTDSDDPPQLIKHADTARQIKSFKLLFVCVVLCVILCLAKCIYKYFSSKFIIRFTMTGLSLIYVIAS
jgi:hypothetical protein